MPDQNDYLKTFAMIAMLSYDIYAKKQLIEKLIDTFPAVTDKKADTKEAKNKDKKDITKQ